MFAGAQAVYRLGLDGWEDMPQDLVEVT